MQEPLLSAIPPNQQVDREIPDPVRSRAGLLYPRWPLLSAILLNACWAVGYLLWLFVPCPAGLPGFLTFLCNLDSWPGPAQFFAMWFFFLLFWLLSFIFGYRPIEGSRRRSGPIRSFLRSASNFEPIRWLLAVYAGFALLAIIVMFVRNQLQAMPFAMCSIIVFVAIWIFIRRPRQPARQLTAQEQYERSLADTASPLFVFRSLPLIRGIWPPSPSQANPGTAAPGRQQPPP